MNLPVRLRAILVAQFLATPLLIGLAGCGGQSEGDSGANDPSSKSVSKYEEEIAKSKAATPKKPGK